MSAAMLQVAKGFEMSTQDGYNRWRNGTFKIPYTPGMQTNTVSEAEEGAVPIGQNTPQRCPLGLYAEQLSGTSFTTPRAQNQRNWAYRLMPAVRHTKFRPIAKPNLRLITDFSNEIANPLQCRWDPLPLCKKPTKFYQGIVTFCGSGSAESKSGMAVHMYSCNESMINESFCNADGDLLIVPQKGDLLIRTEYGWLEVPSGFIAVIQRGIHFSVMVKEASRGYIAEVFESHFVIPDLGPIGANGLANPRDFETCVASYEKDKSNSNNNSKKKEENSNKMIQKFLFKLFECYRDGSIFNVVGWHGNYVPFRYDLSKFCAINSVTFDHIDPSIFTVLTAQTAHPGVAACDFVIFPPRWSVHTNTFRPPYYHRYLYLLCARINNFVLFCFICIIV